MKWHKCSEKVPVDTNQKLLCKDNGEWEPSFTTGWYHAETGKWVTVNRSITWDYWTEIFPPGELYGT